MELEKCANIRMKIRSQIHVTHIPLGLQEQNKDVHMFYEYGV